MLGNTLILLGVSILLYVAGWYAQIEYNRRAARGTSLLPLLTTLTTDQSPIKTQNRQPAMQIPLLGLVDPPPGDNTAHRSSEWASTIKRVVIPGINLDAKVVEVGWYIEEHPAGAQAMWEVAEYAVGHHRLSANPGENDNIVLAGHVGGYGLVFRDLFYVQPGDEILLYTADQQYLYIVQERLLVDEEGVSVEQRAANARYIQSTAQAMLTLVTCWPPDGPDLFTQRVIVRATPYGAIDADDRTWIVR